MPLVNYFRGLLKKADDLEEENDKLKEENKELKETITKMSGNLCVPQSIVETWIEDDQIDPHLLIGNADDLYKQDENGKWIKMTEEEQEHAMKNKGNK